VSHRPVYVVCGNAGVGKSTYGLRLASQLGAALLDSDQITERFVQLILGGYGLPPDDRDSPEYKRLLRDPVYETLYDLAATHCAFIPCVLVGPFTRECRTPDWPVHLEARINTEAYVHYLHCSPAERLRRLERRKNPRDRAKLADWPAYLATCNEAPPPFEHVFITTDGQR
jgi:gluconate kinase